jgi:squalene synthase HpnC
MGSTKADRTLDLGRYGPGLNCACSLSQAQAWCMRLARGHGENFSVLSGFVPQALHNDFAAVYAFCRCADDLGDESGSREQASALLAWWREGTEAMGRGQSLHPVFTALAPVLARHAIPLQPFLDLILAFEQDQSVCRYGTWDELIGYCRLSADPVGRIVLMLLDESRDDAALAASDAICTGLQLVNHWQDVRRDMLERGRIYLPAESWQGELFAERLLLTCERGYAPDRVFLGEYRATIRSLVERTWPLFESGGELLARLQPKHRPLIWLFRDGGIQTLKLVESWNFETCLARPKLTAFTKMRLLLQARWSAARAVRPIKKESLAA